MRFSIYFVRNNSEQDACLDLKGKRAYALGGLVTAPLDRFCAQEGNIRRVNAAAGFAVEAIRGGHVVQGSEGGNDNLPQAFATALGSGITYHSLSLTLQGLHKHCHASDHATPKPITPRYGRELGAWTGRSDRS